MPKRISDSIDYKFLKQYEEIKETEIDSNDKNKELNKNFINRYTNNIFFLPFNTTTTYGIYNIDIVITDLPVYKNFEDNFKLKVKLNDNLDKLLPYEIYSKYVFMRLFRILFCIDYLHDFTNAGRNNVLIKESNKKKSEIIKELKNFYKFQYNLDINDIKNHILKIKSIINDTKLDDNIILNNFNNNDISLKELDNIIFDLSNQNYLSEYTIYILNFFDVKLISQPDDSSDYDCYNSLDKIISLEKNQQDIDLKIIVDTDKSRFDLYPIVMKMCDLYFNKKTNYKSINIVTSILDLYDGASGSALQGIINKMNEKVKLSNIKVFDNKNYKNINVTIKLDLNDPYSNTYMNLQFKTVTRDNKPLCGLIINRFFALNNPSPPSPPPENDLIYDGSLSNISSKMNEYYNSKISSQNKKSLIVYYSYYKTIGDLSQILFCYQESKINSNSKYIFLSFDKIASYISSLFNYGTLRENYENPLMPLSYFKYNWQNINRDDYFTWNNISSFILNPYKKFKRVVGMETDFGKYKNSKQSIKTYGIPKKELSKSKINSLINLAKKYNIKLNDDTYKNLKRLYKLQLLAKKYKIPITYTKQVKINKKNVSKRFYKSISMLEKNLF
jgi:hypothetical protein